MKTEVKLLPAIQVQAVIALMLIQLVHKIVRDTRGDKNGRTRGCRSSYICRITCYWHIGARLEKQMGSDFRYDRWSVYDLSTHISSYYSCSS